MALAMIFILLSAFAKTVISSSNENLRPCLMRKPCRFLRLISYRRVSLAFEELGAIVGSRVYACVLLVEIG